MSVANAEGRRRYRAKHLVRLREEDRIKAAVKYAKDPTKQKEASRKAAAKRRAIEPEVVRETMRINMANWRKRGSVKAKVANLKNTAARRARLKGAKVPLTPQEHRLISEIYAKTKMLSELTGEAYHVDHILPLAAGGKHHPDNLQILTALENLKKGARVILKG